MPKNLFGQVFTPQGSNVYVIYTPEKYSPAEKEALRQDFAKTYPKAIYMGEATSKYNCHAYAWSISEGNTLIAKNLISQNL